MFNKSMLVESCKGQAERNKAVKTRALSVLKEDLTVGDLIFIASLLSDILVPARYSSMEELLGLVDVDYFNAEATYSLHDVLMMVDDIETYKEAKVTNCPSIQEIVNFFVVSGDLVFINGN